MKRRDFLHRLGWGLAGGWAVSQGLKPGRAAAASGPQRLALLADAHLRDGRESRAEARALARAVAEIGACKPGPDLVLFAGDLAHDGNTNALALGREILSGLPAPLLMVMGEGDGAGPNAAAWSRLFGEPRFSLGFGGCHVLGLHTFLRPSPRGQVFRVGGGQRRWLARELAHLHPDTPLVILSHAPLAEIFRPWRQWTQDGEEVLRLLSGFSQVFCFHGHVHHGAVSRDFREGDQFASTADRRPRTEDYLWHYGLPATAWPLPSPLQGTLAAVRPGLGPQGCGWALVSCDKKSLAYQPQVWRA